jgi:PDZ domain-containing protein
VVGAIVIALVYGLENFHTNEYAITPGTATPVAKLVKIHGVATNPKHDTIMLADVYLTQLTPWEWIADHFSSHVQFVPGYELTQPGVSDAELVAQGFLEMRDAKQAAEVTAFRTLGWRVPATPMGTIVNAVVTPSPASKAGLNVGDEIVGVNGTSIHSSCQLFTYLHGRTAGATLALSVDRVKISNSGRLSWNAPSKVSITTATTPSGTGKATCGGVSEGNVSWLGIGLENDDQYQLPAKVSINTANIGGPSAGLAMTLTLINKLSGGSLTGHHVIAVTGTISLNGDVGPVGGVEEKAVAVHSAGASYFIVPKGDGDLAGARDAHQAGLKILGVTTLKQVLRDLRGFGGVKPQPLTKPS